MKVVIDAEIRRVQDPYATYYTGRFKVPGDWFWQRAWTWDGIFLPDRSYRFGSREEVMASIIERAQQRIRTILGTSTAVERFKLEVSVDR